MLSFRNEYYRADLSVAPTQNLLKAEAGPDANDSSVEEMETEENEVSSGETDNMVEEKPKYNLRSHDTHKTEYQNEGDDSKPKRMRTRSQSSAASEFEDLDMVQSQKEVKKVRTRKKVKVKAIAHDSDDKISVDEDKIVGRKRTRSQCSNSDLEELDFSVVKKTHKKSLGKGHTKSQPVIPEEGDLNSIDIMETSPKKGPTKEGKKKLKQNDKDMEEKEILSGTEKKTDENKGSGKKRKAAKSSLIVQLELFSKFKNPRAVCMEPQLRELYFDLLIHKSVDVQKVAFSCIMSYKYKYLMPYRENFDRLLDDKTFKNEIVLFSIDHDNSVVSSEHRPEVLPILMRILYGKMKGKTGKGTSGKQYSGVRQSLVLRFLNGCQQHELETFVDLVFAPFLHFLTDDPYGMVLDITENIDFTKVLPVRKLQGALNTVDVIFKKLGHLMDSYLPKLIQIIIGMATVCSLCLENRTKLVPNVIAPLKTVRHLALYRLIQIFKDYDKYEWSISEIDAVFAAVVWPQLERLPLEGLNHPTPLLKLLHCWSEQPRCFNLLAKHRESSTSVTPLPYIFKLLLSPHASKVVKMFIMEIVENLMLPVETEELQEVKVIEVNHMLNLSSVEKLNGKMQIYMYNIYFFLFFLWKS